MKHRLARILTAFGVYDDVMRQLVTLKREPRFANQSAQIKQEMLDKAACKRQMRAAKRVAGVQK